jgi:ribonuclease R
MLPHKLSNGICSLNPDVDRLTFTCDMEIDSTGKVVKYDIYKSVINSHKRMTYKNVNKVLAGEFVEDYEKFRNSLTMMADLAKILRKSKLDRGYLDFNIDEIKVVVDEEGKPIDVKVRDRGVGENLIEDTMIITNETVAEYVFNMDYPFIYRVHDKPKEEKIKKYLELLNTLGHRFKGSIKSVTPKFIQNILNSIKGSPDFEVLSEMGLRSMQKAEYSTENIGHFGLASKCYTHFTAPNRRYPDLAIQTLLNKYLSGEELNSDTLKGIYQNLVYIADHSSLKEKEATDCERDVDDMKTAEYMEDHIGEVYKGRISGVMPSGMFVMLENLIEGFVHVSTLKGDYYTLDEKTYTLRGKNDKKGYRMGDTVTVKVIAASKNERTIDFELVKNEK